MKTEHQKRVEKFMKNYGQDIPNDPTIPSRKILRLRANLITEEYRELMEALGYEIPELLLMRSKKRPNLTKIADGCADLSVVTIGTLSACGIPDRGLLKLVDENNLDKFRGDAYEREDGKWVKPSDHKPPKIKKYLDGVNNEK